MRHLQRKQRALIVQFDQRDRSVQFIIPQSLCGIIRLDTCMPSYVSGALLNSFSFQSSKMFVSSSIRFQSSSTPNLRLQIRTLGGKKGKKKETNKEGTRQKSPSNMNTATKILLWVLCLCIFEFSVCLVYGRDPVLSKEENFSVQAGLNELFEMFIPGDMAFWQIMM